jgi:hypothetical protein
MKNLIVPVVGFVFLAAPHAAAGDVLCCFRDTHCVQLEDAECENQQAAEVDKLASKGVQPEPRDIEASCGTGRDVLNTVDTFAVAVDSCTEPIVVKGVAGKARTCVLRDVLMTAGTVSAGSETYSVIWPIFAQRWEHFFPQFEDPVPGKAYWVRLDSDFETPTIFAAETLATTASVP